MKQEHEDVSRYLNGEIEWNDLPEPLRQEAAHVQRIVGALRRERVSLPRSVRVNVMTRVREVARSPWVRAWDWMREPRLSPLAGAVVAAALLAAIWLKPTGEPRAPESGAAAGHGTAPTRFVFLAPTARHVAITGDWVHWDPAGIPLTSPKGDGVWVGEVVVPAGLHHYVFVVDGTEWRPDPNAASQVDDGFGQRNSVLLVTGQRGS